MAKHHQDRALQALARSISETVNILGTACTARLLGTIAFDLAGSGDSGVPNAASDKHVGQRPARSHSVRKHQWSAGPNRPRLTRP